jgi:hypothetical protein
MDITSAEVVTRFLDVIEQDVLPLTEAAVKNGNRHGPNAPLCSPRTFGTESIIRLGL